MRDQSFELPPLPVSRLRALQLAARADCELGDVLSVVETDPGLSGSMLRIANSAASSPINRVGTAKHAVVRIGLAEARKVLAGAVLNTAFSKLRGSGIDVDELWRHLLAVALITESLAPAESAPDAFAAGLLHDVGRIAMALADPGRYFKVATAVRAGDDPRRAEAKVFGRDHTEWGAQVARAWRLPETLADAISDHHNVLAGPPVEWTARSRAIAIRLGIGDGLTPSAETYPAGAEEPILALGGMEGLQEKIDEYQHAIVDTTALAVAMDGYRATAERQNAEPPGESHTDGDSEARANE